MNYHIKRFLILGNINNILEKMKLEDLEYLEYYLTNHYEVS